MTPELSRHLASDLDIEHVQHARMVNGQPHTTRLVPYNSIAQLLLERAREHAQDTWLIFHPDHGHRQSCTYEEFLAQVRRTAHLLVAHGVRRGDRICTVSHTHAETVVHYFAAWFIGAVVVPVNIGEDDRRIEYIIADSHAKLAFIRTPYLHRIAAMRDATPELQVIIETGDAPGGQHPSWRSEAARMDPNFDPGEKPGLDDDALIVYTSGTTGNPKGVVLDQYSLLVDAQAIAAWHGMDASQRMMCVLPIHHVNGTVVTLLTPMYFGGSVVLNQKFHTEKFFELVAIEGVHVVSVVPTLLQFLLHERVDHSGFDLSRFRHIICGAGPLTCELAQAFESAFGIPIVHGYGLSETTCYSCFLPVDLDADEHRSWMSAHGFPSIGVALPVNEMDIQTADGTSLPEGERGEIVIRGHNVMRYYYGNPEANTVTFANGWFRSGDEGFYRTDASGRKFFFITGRIKELIIRGGVNIAPLEIDEVINTCPGVKAGIAVGFENDWYGEEVGALVSKGKDELTEAEVLQHCRKHLPHAKAPKVVIFSDEIPVTSTGKYQRNRVKHLFAEWKSVQFHR